LLLKVIPGHGVGDVVGDGLIFDEGLEELGEVRLGGPGDGLRRWFLGTFPFPAIETMADFSSDLPGS